MKTKFIEMSRFKVLLTGCVLLLMSNCYQLYGDDFLVYYCKVFKRDGIETKDLHPMSFQEWYYTDVKRDRIETKDLHAISFKEWTGIPKIFLYAESGSIGVDRRPGPGTTITVDLNGIESWTDVLGMFETAKIIKKQNNIGNDSLRFLHNFELIDIYSSPGVLEKIVVRESPLVIKIDVFTCLGSLQQEVNENAERCYQYAISNVAKGTIRHSDALLRFGDMYKKHRKFQQAKLCYKEALEIESRSEFRDVMAIVICHIADLYEKQENFTAAEKCYLVAEKGY